jgi:hypothetical protein
MSETITDEMPTAWVRGLADRIEAYGHEVLDAHESAITVSIHPAARTVLGAQPGQVLVIGWTERGGLDWGLADDETYVPDPQPLGGDDGEYAARVHRILTTGRPEPRPLRHAIPYTAASTACICERVHPCGGIVPNAECPDHGSTRNPAMRWHWEDNCDRIVHTE